MENKEYSAKKTLKNSSLYFITSLLQKAISFFLLPVYTIFLSPDDYGLVSLISTFVGVVALLITLSLNGAISRYYFVYKSNELKQREFIGTIIIGITINCIIWFVLILTFRDVVTSVFLKDLEFFPYVFLALLSTITSPIYSIYQSILQIRQEAKEFSINSLLYFILALSLNLLFIAGLDLGAYGLLLANAIPSILFSAFAVYTLIRKKFMTITFRWSYMVEALRFSIPLIPHILSGSIADYISKNILYLKSNLANVGLYNIAFQFGTIIDIIQTSIYNALLPMTYDTLDNKRDEIDHLIKTNTLFFKLICFFALGMSLLSKEVVYFMTSSDNFNSAWKAIPLIAFGSLFYSLYTTYGTLLFYNIKGTRYIWIASLSGNIANIAFTVWLTSQFKYLTPAIAGVFQKIIMFLIVYYLSRKLEPVKYELKKMFLIILLFIFASLIGLAPDIIQQNEKLNILSFLWKAAIFLIASIILLYEDRSKIITLVKQFIWK